VFALDIVSAGAPAAPEPGVWAMMILGFAGIALLRIRTVQPAA